MRAVPQRTQSDAHFIAGFDGLTSPSGARQYPGARGLERPVLRSAAVIRLHEYGKYNVRIGPLKILDGALERQRLGRFVHGEGMMRRRRGCGAERHAQGSDDDGNR